MFAVVNDCSHKAKSKTLISELFYSCLEWRLKMDEKFAPQLEALTRALGDLEKTGIRAEFDKLLAFRVPPELAKESILRGPYIGGNFWADPEGTGYSETCVDENSNGICDSSYPVAGGGSDNSPLFPRIPASVTALESKLDAEAYEQGLAARPGAGNETETPMEEVTEEETEPAGEGEETTETEASEENGAPGPGLGLTVLATGAAYILKRKGN